MSNRDNFTGGFIVGTLLGGAIGGAIGVIIGSKLSEESPPSENGKPNGEKPSKLRKRQLQRDESMEPARRSLENKIAQLNDAIDDVRHQLSHVNGTALEETQPQSVREES
ncbi:hypothetical protein [Phormidium sp. CCY1219]|uniref:hypothetical protein n=1 Tax=Phormidium sp. CCY1219 TaxID=2886104 RepID=UPI002D1F2568|nr:hypothetical protein [Phormidium sp. CCY1219]MEB3829990.1 hypothetical protein [Phormidium sp. CCY1219]